MRDKHSKSKSKQRQARLSGKQGRVPRSSGLLGCVHFITSSSREAQASCPSLGPPPFTLVRTLTMSSLLLGVPFCKSGLPNPLVVHAEAVVAPTLWWGRLQPLLLLCTLHFLRESSSPRRSNLCSLLIFLDTPAAPQPQPKPPAQQPPKPCPPASPSWAWPSLSPPPRAPPPFSCAWPWAVMCINTRRSSESNVLPVLLRPLPSPARPTRRPRTSWTASGRRQRPRPTSTGKRRVFCALGCLFSVARRRRPPYFDTTLPPFFPSLFPLLLCAWGTLACA